MIHIKNILTNQNMIHITCMTDQNMIHIKGMSIKHTIELSVFDPRATPALSSSEIVSKLSYVPGFK